MGASSIYGLPWPELSNQADGPDALQDLAAKLETTLGAFTRSFSQLPGDFLLGSGTHNNTLSAVPLGRPTLVVVSLTCRITSAVGQYAVYQLFDGATLAAGGLSVQADDAGTASNFTVITPVTLIACRTWTNAPVFRCTAGGGGGDTISTENVTVTGLGFNWPS